MVVHLKKPENHSWDSRTHRAQPKAEKRPIITKRCNSRTTLACIAPHAPDGLPSSGPRHAALSTEGYRASSAMPSTDGRQGSQIIRAASTTRRANPDPPPADGTLGRRHARRAKQAGCWAAPHTGRMPGGPYPSAATPRWPDRCCSPGRGISMALPSSRMRLGLTSRDTTDCAK